MFRTHINKKHKPWILKEQDDEITDVKVDGLSCDKCNLEFTDSTELRTHILQEHSTDKHPCDLCDFKCSSAGDLKLHIGLQHVGVDLQHDGLEYSCDQCDYKTKNKRRLPEHIREAMKFSLYLNRHLRRRIY